MEKKSKTGYVTSKHGKFLNVHVATSGDSMDNHVITTHDQCGVQVFDEPIITGTQEDFRTSSNLKIFAVACSNCPASIKAKCVSYG